MDVEVTVVKPTTTEPKVEPPKPQPPTKPVKEEKTFSYADAAKGKYRHTTESGPPKEGIHQINHQVNHCML